MIRNSAKRVCLTSVLLGGTLFLAACGGSQLTGGPPSTQPTPARGELRQDPPTRSGTFSAADLLTQLGASPFAAELASLALSPVCTVNIYHMEYTTVGGANELSAASGALMIPSGTAAGCQGPFPVVVYAHGTSPDKNFNLADITASSSTEGLLMAAIFGSQGYIVVAPNYAGYDTSDLAYHPYLDADQQSKDMIDALTAAKSALGSLGASASGKVFVTGYSQGGFVAMATHRAMQAAGIAVTASAPMSGPYALAAFADAVFEGEVNSSGPLNFALIAISYQHAYGNLYTQPGDLFESQYAAGLPTLLPTAQPVTALYAAGQLPHDALFSSTPPAPEYASITPATQPAALASVFAQGFGSGNLVTNSYRLAYLEDAAAQPDGGFPAVTTGVTATAPASGLRQDFKTNDLRNWTPTAPVLLCAGSGDPTVFHFNTDLMQQYWAAHAPTAPVSFLDVDSAVATEDPYAAEKEGFAAAKLAVQLTEGSAGVLDNYHAALVAPFCVHAVKSFFDAH